MLFFNFFNFIFYLFLNGIFNKYSEMNLVSY